MSWNVVAHKVAGIRAGLNDWELQAFEREFLESTKSMSRIARASRSLRGTIFIDLIYALTRHREWLQVPVFSALLVEFLQLDHAIPRGEAEVLTHDLIEAAAQLGVGRSRSICHDDREFLMWAYICAAAATDEDALESDLGLGTAVLQKLRDGLSALERVDSNVFVPEYDAMLATIVIELSHECKRIPWAMDFHRLKYALLSGVGDRAQPYILEESLPRIFESLIAIGCGDCYALIDRPSLAQALEEANIIQQSDSSRRSRKKVGHVLSDLGFKITAWGAASSRFSQGIDCAFVNLHSKWQLAILKKGYAKNLDVVESSLRTSLNRLAPEVVEAMLGCIMEQSGGKLSAEFVGSLLSGSQMAWHKAAILRALRAGRPSRDMLELVASELSQSVSPGLRLAAGALLDAWTDTVA
jgi:hypothetical protein